MNSNEIEEKITKDNISIKNQIADLQNTIKKLKQDMFNNSSDPKLNITSSQLKKKLSFFL